MITPYSYQRDCLQAVTQARRRGRTKVLIVMASGLGKTITAAFDVRRWLRSHLGTRVLYLCHQNDILEQAHQTFANVLGWQGAGRLAFFHGSDRIGAFEADIVFASFQTMRELRTAFEPSTFAYVVVDESHHSHAQTYRPTLEYFTSQFLLGITATPDRMDFQDIRTVYGSEVFNLPLEDALARRLLTRVDYRVVTDELSNLDVLDTTIGKLSMRQLNRMLFVPKRDKEIVKIVRRHMEGVERPRVMIFCRSTDHCNRMAEMMPGALAIHSRLVGKEQRRRLQKFRDGGASVVVVVDKFNEGIDVPDANLIVFLRSTASETVFLQQLGRGLRKERGKRKVLVLDFVANCERLEMVHSLWRKVSDRGGAGEAADEAAIEVDIGRVSFTEVARRILDVLGAIRTGYTREMLIQQLQKLARELHRVPQYRDVARHSRTGKCASEVTFVAFFGSFNAALRAAGFKVSREVGYTKADLIRQLQELAVETGRTPKQEEVKAASTAKRRDNFGVKFASANTYLRVFRSWQAATEAAGLEDTSRPNYTKVELVRWLQAVADKLGHAPTVSEWACASRSGECPHLATYVTHFESREAALKAAGLTSPNKMGCSEDELISQLQSLAAKLGRTPTKREFAEDPACASDTVARDRFGSFLAFLKAAGQHLNRVGYYSNDEIVRQLKGLRESLGRRPSVKDIDQAAQAGKCVNAKVLRDPRHFGSVEAALAQAGMTLEFVTKGDLIRAVRELAEKVGRPPTVGEAIAAYKQGDLVRHPMTMVKRLGGSWKAVLEAAGFSASRAQYDRSTLIRQFRDLASQLGRVPTRRDVDAASKVGTCASSPTYVTWFTTWQNLVSAAGL